MPTKKIICKLFTESVQVEGGDSGFDYEAVVSNNIVVLNPFV
jgi:hypothetical protein